MINEYVVLDLEMTGLSAKTDQIIEIGAVKICNDEIIDRFGNMPNELENLIDIARIMLLFSDGKITEEEKDYILDAR